MTAGTYSIGQITSLNIASTTPSSITFPLIGAMHSITTILNCPYQTCFSGTVFCDDNNNGIYDSLTESIIPNMPVSTSTINSNATDSSGFFMVNIGSTSPIIYDQYLTMPASWLTANGLYYPSTYFIVDTLHIDSNCLATVPSVYIPVHCNLTNLDSVCFDGIAFEDVNANGLFDSGEATLANAPISLTVGSTLTLIYSDSSGYYSYNGVHIGGVSNISLEIYQWWLNNNGLVYNGPITIQNFNCDSNHTANIGFSSSPASINNLFFYPYHHTICDTLSISISPEGLDTNSTQDVNISFTGTNLLNKTYGLTIDWGDGTTTTHTGNSISSNTAIIWSPAVYHIYNTTSYLPVNCTLSSAQSSTSSAAPVAYVRSGYCDNFALNFTNSYLDCDNDGIIDDTIQIGLPSNSFYIYNSTDTIFPLPNSGPNSFWPNSILPGTYSIGFNYGIQYLTSSLLQADPNNINTVTFPNLGGNIPVINQVFNCIPDTICLTGFVFCDANANGIFDPSEIGLSNSVLNTTPYGTTNLPNNSSIDTTDSSGYYSLTWIATDSSAFELNLNQNWLNLNGYSAIDSSFYFNILTYYNGLYISCDTALNFNIPIICNVAISDSICVSGQVFCDIDNDGILDTNETVIPNAPVTISLLNGSGTFTTFADSLGNYTYHNYHPNTDSVEVVIPSYWLVNNGYDTISPTTVSVLDCSINTNIGIDCNTALPCDDNWITINSIGPYYQNWTNTMAVTFSNSNYIFPGSVYTISIDLPSGSTFNPTGFSFPGYTLVGNTLSWTQTISGFDTLNLNFDIAAGIPDSTNHLYTATISGPNLDCDSTNNTNTYTSVVGASYDPNNKLVSLPKHINPAIQEELVYTINFQNTGTAPAQNILIEDELSQYLDWNSLQVISKSHNMFYTIDANGKVNFTFPQIWLPDSTTNEPLSHGYVTYKIMENNNVPLNQSINNTAYIFFDLNPAIITNTTSNTNVTLGLTVSDHPAGLTLYPNPTTGQLTILSNEQIKNIKIYDLSGKLVFESLNFNKQINLDLHHLSKGMYHVKTLTETGTYMTKLILK